MSDISEQLAKARAYYYENGDIGMEEMVGRAHDEIERLRAAYSVVRNYQEASKHLAADKANLLKEIERLRAALREIRQPTRGTELWMSEKEMAEVYWGHIKRFQRIAREALDE